MICLLSNSSLSLKPRLGVDFVFPPSQQSQQSQSQQPSLKFSMKERTYRSETWYVSLRYLPNPTYQTQPTKQNLPKQTYQIQPTKSNPPNQTYQTKPTKPNLPNPSYQTKPTKPTTSNLAHLI